MPDTDKDACAEVQGSGCAFLDGGPDSAECAQDSAAADSAAGGGGGGNSRSGNGTGDSGADTGTWGHEAEDDGTRVVQGGGLGFGCNAGAASMELAMVMIAALVARRRTWVRVVPVILVGVALAAASAHAADASGFRVRDGGEFVALQEDGPGVPWVPSAAVAVSDLRNPVVVADTFGNAAPLLSVVDTLEVAASVRVDDDARIGVFVPTYVRAAYDGEQVGPVVGDAGAWAQLSFLHTPTLGVAASVELVLPTGPADAYLGAEGGRLRGTVSAGYRWDRWSALLNLGAVATGDEALPGLAWGARWEYGAGLRRSVGGPVGVGAEVVGSLPLDLDLAPAGAGPVEVLLSTGVSSPAGFGGRLALGGGLSRGLGSPSSRVVLVGEYRPPPASELDGDGIPDRIDACPATPEDFDGVADLDGCPEEDADGDGFRDQNDRCPEEAEVFNGYQDEDGCLDLLVPLSVRVESTDPARPVETAEIQVDELDAVMVLAEQAESVLAPPGRRRMTVRAEGFHERVVEIELTDAAELTISLDPIVSGKVQISLRDPDGTALAGTVHEAGALVSRVASAGPPIELPVGAHEMTAHSPGFRVEPVTFDVRAAEITPVVVTLHPSAVRVIGSRIDVGDTIFFANNSSRIEPGALAVLGEVLRLLQDDPGLLVIRIEGHADEAGASHYNLGLSRARAEAVYTWLARQGIAEARLEAVGSGEAKLAPGAGETRTVEFLVLAWAE